jgi:hypothetical protein
LVSDQQPLRSLRPHTREQVVAFDRRERQGLVADLVEQGPSAGPTDVAARIIAGIDADEAMIWPYDASAGAASVYLSDPVKLEQLLAG